MDVWIYYQNARGLRTKIDDLFLASCDCGFDIIVLTETGLNDSINSEQLSGPEFNVYRCDRNLCNSSKSSFGGVLIAIAAKHVSYFIVTLSGSAIEQVCVAASIRGTKISMCAVYIPPDRSRDVAAFDQHVASVREICDKVSPNEVVLVCGDYNQPRLSWVRNDNEVACCSTSVYTPASLSLIDGMDFLNLRQQNLIQNHLGRILDLVFTNTAYDSIMINESSAPLLRVDSHHPPLVISVSLPFPSDNAPTNIDRNVPRPLNYKKLDFDELSDYLSNTDWNLVLNSDRVDNIAEKFCSYICQWLTLNVPISQRPVSPAWSSADLRRLKRTRNACQRRLRHHRTMESVSAFRSSSNAYQSAASDEEVERAIGDVPTDIVDLDMFEITQSMVLAATNKLKNTFSPGPDVWGCFSWYGVGLLYWVEKIMDQYLYAQTLRDVMLLHTDWKMPLKWQFMQDNDPKHTDKTVKKWFHDNKVDVMDVYT
ncbi:uncharacterized protein LOC129782527 [Toxorhynchites rutilus septentrionalis]|uniref:uncharacterized protein LOC129782527 n=1 Tax=Toxorhynchites rutilus septentrionalis TaxID=329112 RepID=UPI0024791933|nr:uncharacterized protein LOC129782527 [Toxorhynchites rutilus septentrionalis]